jgi:very-short-patch-repair endonuclease
MTLVRNLRNAQTDAERKLWTSLRTKRLDGFKFKRQQPIGEYIVDFVSFETNLIVELDGGQHNETMNLEKDEQRTNWLKSRGYGVLRFWNNEVLENLDGVLLTIREATGNRGES